EMEALLPAIPHRFFAPRQDVFPAIGPRRARVGLLSGCVMSVLFADLNEATIRVLQRNGCEVVVPRAQTCCGALNLHNGERDRARVTSQDPCHPAHGQGIRRQPRDLLRRIPGIELVEMPGSDRCCGSAGIYNLTQPGYSRQVLDEKMAAVRETGAALVVAPNP